MRARRGGSGGTLRESGCMMPYMALNPRGQSARFNPGTTDGCAGARHKSPSCLVVSDARSMINMHEQHSLRFEKVLRGSVDVFQMEQAECTYRSGYLYPTDTRRRTFPSFLISHLAKAAL
ncbi:hypothetical protein AURANDRAFT_69417, partial [Aureococcus anophagefferens]